MAVRLSQPIADGGAPCHSGGSLGGAAPERSLLVRTCSSHKERGGQPPYPAGDLARPEDLRNARRRVLATAQADTARMPPAWRRSTGAFYQHARPALPTPPSSPSSCGLR
jgi:hypothetical protein